MRCLARNKTAFYYANYKNLEPMTDEYGNLNGEYILQYSNPIKAFANISSARGETQIQQFGESEEYDKVIATENDLDINENSILWVDTLAVIEADGTTKTPHDYIVKKVAKSLNVTSIAITKVEVQN